MSTKEVLDDDTTPDLVDWIGGKERYRHLAPVVAFAPLLWAFATLDSGEPRRDRLFYASWGSATVSSFGFGGVLLGDVAYATLYAVGDAAVTVAAAIAARPLLLPSAFAVLSLVGFAWSAVLYRKERDSE